ncbi:amidohydrolase family protein [Bradyrhizobium symbiodeficiens]|uniref:Amidohydrolase family protein n=1 Tax=Bradyrhizobium symbiodeficiens TaxID=1404367 RepID=A0ABX5W717_9BRAD|nr:amidohydrolase family protein [Bradyrhizobium symbiodeficiens]QDF38810.1 amidohydrolase [Bradyrhizobium symbiodeficiens]
MTTTDQSLSEGRLNAIDCDVHPAVESMKVLLPYFDEHWQEQVTVRGIDGLNPTSYPPEMRVNCRSDWRGRDRIPVSKVEQLSSQALDGLGSQLAICNCLYGVQSVYDENFAAALARAVNSWIQTEWLDREPRLRASIIIPTQNPDLAVAEIERLALDRRFVQVMVLAMGDMPLGRRFYWPIYEACARHGLPLGIHAGSAFRHAPSCTGWPSYYLEDYVAQAESFQAQLASLICEGVFTKYPGLSVVMMESGFSWLPNFMWRSNKTWRAMRAEIPWVERPPADIIRDHVRFTLQPTDEPPLAADLDRILNQIGTDEALLFSTDYPHWHFEGTDMLPVGLSPTMIRKIAHENPRKAFPRLKEVAA